MNARDWTLAEIDRRIALCREATPGPWYWTAHHEDGMGGPDLRSRGVQEDVPHSRSKQDKTVAAGWGHDWWGMSIEPPDQTYIAAHDPTSLAALYEWMRGEVWDHSEYEGRCSRIGCNAVPEHQVDGCCYWLRRLASALGYPGSGEGGLSSLPGATARCPECTHAMYDHNERGCGVEGCSACIQVWPPAAPVQSGGAP